MQVTILSIPGGTRSVTMAGVDSATVADVFNSAGISPQGRDIRRGGVVLQLTDIVSNGETLQNLQQVKGNE